MNAERQSWNRSEGARRLCRRELRWLQRWRQAGSGCIAWRTVLRTEVRAPRFAWGRRILQGAVVAAALEVALAGRGWSEVLGLGRETGELR